MKINPTEYLRELNRLTTGFKIKEARRHMELNRAMIKQYGTLKLFDLQGRYALVIGAGTSLEDNIFFIIKNRKSFFIICADMAYRPLIKYGIKPDICFTTEVAQLPFFYGIDTKNCLLAACSTAANSNIKQWEGKVRFYNLKVDSWEWQKMYKKHPKLMQIASGGNVVTIALSYAIACNPLQIILIGNDLGFKDRYYAKESVRNYEYQVSCNRLKSVETHDRHRVTKNRSIPITRGDDFFWSNDAFIGAKLWIEQSYSKYNIVCTSDMGVSGEFINKGKLQ